MPLANFPIEATSPARPDFELGARGNPVVTRFRFYVPGDLHRQRR